MTTTAPRPQPVKRQRPTFSVDAMKRAREERRVYQREVAARVGVSLSLVEKWEAGNRNMRIEQFVDYARAIGYRPEDLLRKCLTKGDQA